jgi:hypothetical protein
MAAREKKAPQETSPSLMPGWARQGVQSFVAAQKIIMDLAAQENALLIGMARETLSKQGAQLAPAMAGIAEKGVKNLTTIGKILLDLAADETALTVEGVKAGLRLPAPAGAMAEVVRHRVGTIVEMQKNLLDVAAEQAHAIAESYREGENPHAATRAAEVARRGIEEFVASEKKFLDLAAQEVTTAAKGEKRATKPHKDRMEVLTTMAREGAEKYIETQKKLLALAIDQLEEAAKPAREHKDGGRKEAKLSWEEVTEKSVHNFVAAEKSLLDLATKRMEGLGHEKGRKGVRAHRGAPRGAKRHISESEETVRTQA